jgi:integrase/recombinase XerD
MEQKKVSKTVELARAIIPGLEERIRQFEDWLTVHGRTPSTILNYSRSIAVLALHYSLLPEKISEAEFNEFLSHELSREKIRSRSGFKHFVYGLRAYKKMLGGEMTAKLPVIRKEYKLPVVLNKEECRMIFAALTNVRHKLMLMFMYSAGLRTGELLRLKWADIDTERMLIHVKKSKARKDRYLPLSKNLFLQLTMYYEKNPVGEYVFYTKDPCTKIGRTALRWVMNRVIARTGLKKNISLHTFRHTFATHLLEDGLDIVSIKELLGHSRLETTLIYLQVSNCERRTKVSPLDNLMGPVSEHDLEYCKSRLSHKIKLSSRDSGSNQMKLFEE